MLHNILDRAHAAASIFDLQVSTTCCTAEAVVLRPCPRPAATPRRALDGWTTRRVPVTISWSLPGPTRGSRSAARPSTFYHDRWRTHVALLHGTTGIGSTAAPDSVARFAGVTGLVSGVAAQPTRTSTVLRLPYVNVQRCCLLTHEELRGQARCSAAPPAPALHGRLGQRARFAL